VRFVDSHLHLDGQHAPGAIALARANKTRFFTCGTDRKTSLDGVGLAVSNRDLVSAFVGLHPSEANREKNLSWLKGALSKAAGLGEVGLDPRYSGIGSRSVQTRVFAKQLEAAEDAGKPVQVHSRGAERECLDLLSEHSLRSVLMHWFQDGNKTSELFARGYYVSFGPALLYSKRLQAMAGRADGGLVLVETDSPVPYAPLGGVSGPSLVPSVVFKLAELWRKSFDEIRATTVENSGRFLGSSGKG